MLVPGGIANSPAWIRRSSPEYRAPNRKIRASEIAPASSRMPEARSMLAPRGIATSAGASSGPSPRHWLAPQPATTARPSTSRISSVSAFAATWRTGSPRLAEHQRGVGAAEAEGVRQRDPDVPLHRLQRREVDLALDRGVLEVQRRRRHLVAQRQQAEDRLDRARRAQQVAGRAL